MHLQFTRLHGFGREYCEGQGLGYHSANAAKRGAAYDRRGSSCSSSSSQKSRLSIAARGFPQLENKVHAGFADSSTDLCTLGCASAG